MKTFKKLILVCAFLAGSFTVPLVYAQTPAPADDHAGSFRKMHGKGERGKFHEMMDQLKLTEEQKQKLKENKAANREKRKASFEQMKSYREELNQELMKPDLDMNKINAIQAKVKNQQSEQTDNRLNSILEVRKILTPEQFSQFLSSMKAEKHEGMQHQEKEEKE